MPELPLGTEAIPAEAASLYYSVIVCDKPAGYWPLDEPNEETDYSGNARTLTPVGAPSDVAPLIYDGRGRDFDGAGQAYTAGDHASLDLGDSFTLEAWVKPGSVAAGAGSIIDKDVGGYQLRREGTTFELLKSDVAVIAATTGVTLAVDETYHIVATKTGATVKLYVNGVDRTGAVTNATCVDTSSVLSIGRKNDLTEHFDGVIDEVAVYPYALTTDMVQMHYEAGVDGSFGIRILPDVPALKFEVAWQSAWNAAYPLWEDETARLRTEGLRVSGSGRPDETQRPSPAELEGVLDNRDRAVDPAYTAGPHGANVKPRRQVRLRSAWGTSPEMFWHFRGWFASLSPIYPSKGFDAKVGFEAVDVFAILNEAIPPDTAFVAELPGVRINTVLDLAGIQTADRNIDAGIVEMPAVEEASGTMLDHLLAVAESDGGFFYAGPDGRLVYEDRTYRLLSETVSRGTFGDGGEDFPTELPYADIAPSSDDAYLFTAAQVTPGDGTPTATYEDATAVADVGRIVYTKSLLTGFNEAQAAAEWYVARYKDPAVRFTGVELNGQQAPDDLWPILLGAQNSHRYTFKMRPLGGGAAMEEDSFIERWEHRLAGGAWLTAWSLSPFGDEDPWILDDAGYVLGTNSYPTW